MITFYCLPVSSRVVKHTAFGPLLTSFYSLGFLLIFTAAAQSGRSVRILHQLTQPGDHPVNIYHPEGEYLKGLVLYVE